MLRNGARNILPVRCRCLDRSAEAPQIMAAQTRWKKKNARAHGPKQIQLSPNFKRWCDVTHPLQPCWARGRASIPGKFGRKAFIHPRITLSRTHLVRVARLVLFPRTPCPSSSSTTTTNKTCGCGAVIMVCQRGFVISRLHANAKCMSRKGYYNRRFLPITTASRS